MVEQKYYWLKLKKDFFKRHDIQIIEAMPNGKEYVLFYLKLLMESIDHEGELRFSDTIPYNEQMLAVITNTNVDVVRSAMQLLKELEMVEILDDATIYMTEVNKMIGSEGASAERMRKTRERKALEQGFSKPSGQECNNVAQCSNALQNCDTEIEKEIEIELDNNNIYTPAKPKKARFVPPTKEQVAEYCRERNNNIDAEAFIDYYSSQKWKKANGQPLTDWKAAVRTWEKTEYNKRGKPPNKDDIIQSGTVYEDVYR